MTAEEASLSVNAEVERNRSILIQWFISMLKFLLHLPFCFLVCRKRIIQFFFNFFFWLKIPLYLLVSFFTSQNTLFLFQSFYFKLLIKCLKIPSCIFSCLPNFTESSQRSTSLRTAFNIASCIRCNLILNTSNNLFLISTPAQEILFKTCTITFLMIKLSVLSLSSDSFTDL